MYLGYGVKLKNGLESRKTSKYKEEEKMGTEITTLVTSMTGVFDEAKAGGLLIVGGAIAVGVIFITASWLWGKAKKWLSKT